MNHLEKIIETFWTELEECKSTRDYIELLVTSEHNVMNLLNTLEGSEFDSVQEKAPILAMISEVDMRCPEALQVLSDTDDTYFHGLSIIQEYSHADRIAIRRDYLNRAPSNLIRIDFNKKG